MLCALSSLEARISGAKTWARLISSSSSMSSSSLTSPPPPPPSSPSSHSSLFDRLGDVLTPEIVAGSLVTRGYAVVDGALDADTCRLLRAEIDSLKGAGLLRPNATFLVKGGGSGSSGGEDKDEISPPSSFPSSLSSATLLEKRGIWETDTWGDAAVSARAPLLSLAGREGARSLAALLSVLGAENFSLSGPAILKAQLNDGLGRGGGGGGWLEGGGGGEGEKEGVKEEKAFPCFPLHFDSDESVDGRRVNAIFYVSERPGSAQEEEAAAGGELLLWPDLFRRRNRKRDRTRRMPRIIRSRSQSRRGKEGSSSSRPAGCLTPLPPRGKGGTASQCGSLKEARGGEGRRRTRKKKKRKHETRG